MSSPFTINAMNGEVSLAPGMTLDYESITSYTLEVTAELLVLGSSRILTLSLTIEVLNESEIFDLVDSDTSANEISEIAVSGTAISGVSLQVIDAMGMPVDGVLWSLSESTNVPFTISTTSGEIVLSSDRSLDYEMTQEYSLIVTADVLFNGTTETSTLNLTIAVLNESDTFDLVDSDASANSISESAPAGTTVSGVSLLQVLR